MASRHLDAKGKGEYFYDYENDILLFKIKEREYRKSVDFQNMTVDIDKEGFITGVRVFDASKVFDLPKVTLKNVSNFRLDASIEDNIITVKLKFTATRRNKPIIKQGQNFSTEASNMNVGNSEVLCTV